MHVCCVFLPRDAMHRADYAIARCPSVRLSHASILWKRLNTSSNFFNRPVATTFSFFSIPNGITIFRWVPHRSAPDSLANWHVGRVTNLFILYCIVYGAKITIFDRYLALGSMTAGASSVVNSFDRVVKFITADADDDRHTPLDFVYDSKANVVFAARCYA